MFLFADLSGLVYIVCLVASVKFMTEYVKGSKSRKRLSVAATVTGTDTDNKKGTDTSAITVIQMKNTDFNGMIDAIHDLDDMLREVGKK